MEDRPLQDKPRRGILLTLFIWIILLGSGGFVLWFLYHHPLLVISLGIMGLFVLLYVRRNDFM